MAFEARYRAAARSGIASTPLTDGPLIKPRPPSAAPFRLRAQLLGGAASLALPAASMIVALGVGLPTEAQAHSARYNGTQATTYTLITGSKAATFTFGPNAVIGPTVAGTAGVTGDTLTSWNIINEGQINGGVGGSVLSQGIFLNTAGGNSVTNSGTITQGVILGAGGTLTNLAAGTITGTAPFTYVSATHVTNAGLINGRVGLNGSGLLGASLTNQSSGIITGGVTGLGILPVTVTNAGTLSGGVYLGTVGGGTVINQSWRDDHQRRRLRRRRHARRYQQHPAVRAGGGTVTNAGTITGTGTTFRGPVGVGGTDGIALTTGSVTNLSGGIITSAAGNGIYIQGSGASSVTNQAGGTITGGVNGVSVGYTAGGPYNGHQCRRHYRHGGERHLLSQRRRRQRHQPGWRHYHWRRQRRPIRPLARCLRGLRHRYPGHECRHHHQDEQRRRRFAQQLWRTLSEPPASPICAAPRSAAPPASTSTTSRP